MQKLMKSGFVYGLSHCVANLTLILIFCEIIADGIVLIKTFFFKAKAVELHVSSQLLGIKKGLEYQILFI